MKLFGTSGVRQVDPVTSEENSMVRNVVGFSVFAVVSVLAIKLIFSVLGGIFAILGTILWLAFWGWIIYMILKVIAPGTAARVKEVISGRPT